MRGEIHSIVQYIRLLSRRNRWSWRFHRKIYSRGDCWRGECYQSSSLCCDENDRKSILRFDCRLCNCRVLWRRQHSVRHLRVFVRVLRTWEDDGSQRQSSPHRSCWPPAGWKRSSFQTHRLCFVESSDVCCKESANSRSYHSGLRTNQQRVFLTTALKEWNRHCRCVLPYCDIIQHSEGTSFASYRPGLLYHRCYKTHGCLLLSEPDDSFRTPTSRT